LKALEAALVALLLAFLGTGPAHAVPLSYPSSQVSVTGGTQGTADAMCPEDRRLTGGGAFSSGAYGETTLNDSHPIDGPDADTKPDDGWRATLDNTTGGFRSLTSLAICAKGIKTRYVPVDFVSQSVAGIAECPGAFRLSGGGVSSEGTFAQPTVITNSTPYDGLDDDGRPESWIGRTAQPSFLNISSTVYAICMRAVKGVTPRYRQKTFTAPAQSQVSKPVRCPADQRVIGVGANTNSAVMAVNTMYGWDGPDADLKPDDGARAYIDNFLTFERSPHVNAICLG